MLKVLGMICHLVCNLYIIIISKKYLNIKAKISKAVAIAYSCVQEEVPPSLCMVNMMNAINDDPEWRSSSHVA
jgi:hypothetical protein